MEGGACRVFRNEARLERLLDQRRWIVQRLLVTRCSKQLEDLVSEWVIRATFKPIIRWLFSFFPLAFRYFLFEWKRKHTYFVLSFSIDHRPSSEWTFLVPWILYTFVVRIYSFLKRVFISLKRTKASEYLLRTVLLSLVYDTRFVQC